MEEGQLTGRRILVVEDEYLLADELRRILVEAGAEVVGPASSVSGADALLDDAPVDAAILDINLRGQSVFSLADRLHEAGVPFAFATGYNASDIPARFAGAPHIAKPLGSDTIKAAIAPMLTT